MASLTSSAPGIEVHRIEHFSSGHHARNGGGDRIVTDGTLPVLDLTGVAAGPGPTHESALPRGLLAPARDGAVVLTTGDPAP